MSTYGDPQRKYYEKRKDTIYRRTLKYRDKYNEEYYAKNREIILMDLRLKRQKKKAELKAAQEAERLRLELEAVTGVKPEIETS